MNVIMQAQAEDDLESAFDHYQSERSGLGLEMLDEFRRGVERIIEQPAAWQSLDSIYRRYRIHRFPYGIVYRVTPADDQIVIVAFMHLAQRPESWRSETL